MVKGWHVLFVLICFDKGKTVSLTDSQTDKASSCSKGWFSFGEMCYKLGGRGTNNVRRLTGEGAAEACRKDYNGNLATIHSKDLEQFLFTFFQMSAKENLFIGLHDRMEESVYTWQDGTPVTSKSYMNWEPTEPSGFVSEDCVEMVIISTKPGGKPGQWNDISCSVPKQFICQKKKGKPSNDYLDPRFCPSEDGGGWKKNMSCFNFIDEEKTWSDAEEYCIQKHRGHLVTITDFTINLFLDYVLGAQEKDMWIGIRTKNQFQQQWSSGWYVSYENWAEGEKSDDFDEGLCTARDQDGKWVTHSCNEMLPFICESSVDEPPILKHTTEGTSCPYKPGDWRDLGGDFCYYFEHKNIVTWHEANFLCMRRGGTLVSIHSPEEAIIFQNFLKFMQITVYYEFKRHYMHIGLYRRSQGEEFLWSDGTPLDFEDWDVNEPSSEKEQCGMVRCDNMKWHDIECMHTIGYICSVAKVSSNQTHKQSANQTILHFPPILYGHSTSVLVAVAVGVLIGSVLIGALRHCFCFSERMKTNSTFKLRLYYKKPKQLSENGVSENDRYADVI